MDIIIIVLTLFFGAYDICCAITRFKEQEYFLFGLEVFLAIWMAAILFAKVAELYS